MSVSLNTLSTSKQDKLTAGTGITIDGNTISASGSSGVKVDNGSGAVGSYAIACPVSECRIANGGTIAGSSLYVLIWEYSDGEYSTTKNFYSTTTRLSGTWRNVSGSYISRDRWGEYILGGLVQRIS